MKVTVKGTWMQACGFPAVNTEMEVIRILGTMPNGRDRMYEVIRPHDNQVWIVSDWRLVTVPEEDARG